MFLTKYFGVKSYQIARDILLSPTKGWGPFSRDVKSDYYHEKTLLPKEDSLNRHYHVTHPFLPLGYHFLVSNRQVVSSFSGVTASGPLEVPQVSVTWGASGGCYLAKRAPYLSCLQSFSNDIIVSLIPSTSTNRTALTLIAESNLPSPGSPCQKKPKMRMLQNYTVAWAILPLFLFRFSDRSTIYNTLLPCNPPRSKTLLSNDGLDGWAK